MSGATLLEPKLLAQLDRLVLVSRRLRAGQIQGERRSPNRGGSVEFADFRTYAPGDDFRQIDWNAYARLERLFLKLFVAEEDLTIHVLLDSSRSMAWGDPDKWDYARRLAGALGYIGLVGLDRLTGAALGESFTPLRALRGKKQALTWFSWLESLQSGGAVNPEAAVREYLVQSRYPGPMLVISDLLGPGWEGALRMLAGRGYDLTVLQLLAPQEVSPALDGDFQLLDSENGAAVEITADYDLLQRYQARLQSWQEGLQAQCAALGAHYVFIETSEPLETLLMSYLRKYDVVR